ncbi:MAG: hypothetical protein ACPHGV_03060 [Synechococcus sp.]
MASIELSQPERDLLLDLLTQSGKTERALEDKLMSLAFHQPVHPSTKNNEHNIGDRVMIHGSTHIPHGTSASVTGFYHGGFVVVDWITTTGEHRQTACAPNEVFRETNGHESKD